MPDPSEPRPLPLRRHAADRGHPMRPRLAPRFAALAALTLIGLAGMSGAGTGAGASAAAPATTATPAGAATPAAATRAAAPVETRAEAPAGTRADWTWPLPGRPPVLRRFEPPPTPYAAGHRGVDLGAAVATPVLAAGRGRVGFAGPVAGRGVVTLVHGALRTTYEPVTPVVAVGDEVSTGEQIGWLAPPTGHCGVGTPCLHWGLLRGDTYLDPLLLLGAARVRLLPLDATQLVPGTARGGPAVVPPAARNGQNTRLMPLVPSDPATHGPETLLTDTGSWRNARPTRTAPSSRVSDRPRGRAVSTSRDEPARLLTWPGLALFPVALLGAALRWRWPP